MNADRDSRVVDGSEDTSRSVAGAGYRRGLPRRRLSPDCYPSPAPSVSRDSTVCQLHQAGWRQWRVPLVCLKSTSTTVSTDVCQLSTTPPSCITNSQAVFDNSRYTVVYIAGRGRITVTNGNVCKIIKKIIGLRKTG